MALGVRRADFQRNRLGSCRGGAITGNREIEAGVNVARTRYPGSHANRQGIVCRNASVIAGREQAAGKVADIAFVQHLTIAGALGPASRIENVDAASRARFDFAGMKTLACAAPAVRS